MIDRAEHNNIFKKILNKYGNEENFDSHALEEILMQLLTELKGSVIFDFIDTSSWDCFENSSINHATKDVLIYWHDFRKIKGNELEREMSRMVFPASVYGLFFHFQSFKIFKINDIPCILLKGYSLEEKDLNKKLQQTTQEFEILKYNVFSELIVRNIKDKIHLINAITSHVFSFAILSKGLRLKANDSRLILLQANFEEIQSRLEKTKKEISLIDNNNFDLFYEKTNTVRRIFENLLKLFALDFGIKFKKPYCRLLAGDLIEELKGYFDSNEIKAIEKITELLNPYSHDSGKPIEKQKIVLSCSIIEMFSELLKIKIMDKYKIA
jgi:hypothetical protein